MYDVHNEEDQDRTEQTAFIEVYIEIDHIYDINFYHEEEFGRNKEWNGII